MLPFNKRTSRIFGETMRLFHVIKQEISGGPVFPALITTPVVPIGPKKFPVDQLVSYSDQGDGRDKGAFQRDFPPPSDGVALLGSFYFLYTDGGTFNPIDKHLQQMLLLPNFTTPDKVFVGYHDEKPDDPDDDFYFQFSYWLVTDPRIGVFDTDQIFGTGSSTQLIPRLEADHVFVLMGFDIGYRADDHHINQIGILEDNNSIRVFFNDENSDDLIQWRVKYASVPADRFTATGEVNLTQQHSFAEQSIPPGPSVIRGFLFDFQPYFTSGNDHHIRDVGVLTPDGKIRIALADENGDDGFDCVVRWGILDTIPKNV